MVAILNEFDVNPYIELAVRAKHLYETTREIEAQNMKFHDEFLKVFLPDQTAFDELKDKAKELQLRKDSKELDGIYYKMAMIYKRWLPIEDILIQKNPSYVAVFTALKFMLEDITKREHGNQKEKDAIKPSRSHRAKKTVQRGDKRKGSSASV